MELVHSQPLSDSQPSNANELRSRRVTYEKTTQPPSTRTTKGQRTALSARTHHHPYRTRRGGSRFGSPPGSWRGHSPSSSKDHSGPEGNAESDSEEGQDSDSSSRNAYDYCRGIDVRRPFFVSPYKSDDQRMYLRSSTRDRMSVMRMVEHIPRDWMNAVHSIVSYKLQLCPVKEKRKLISDVSTVDYVLSGARNTNLNQERSDMALLKILAHVPNEWIERIGDLLEKKIALCDFETIRRIFFHVAPLDEIFTHGILQIIVSHLAVSKPTSAVQRPIVDGLSSVLYVNRVLSDIAFELRWRNIEEREIVFNKISQENLQKLFEQRFGCLPSDDSKEIEEPRRPRSSPRPMEQQHSSMPEVLGLDEDVLEPDEIPVTPSSPYTMPLTVAVLENEELGSDDESHKVFRSQRLSLLASSMLDRMSGMRTHLESFKRIPSRVSQKIMYKLHCRKSAPVEGFDWNSFELFCTKIEFTRITFKCDYKQFDTLIDLLKCTCPNLRYIQFILSAYKVNALKDDASIVSRLQGFPLRRIKFHNWMLARDLIRFLQESYHSDHQHLYGLQMHIWLTSRDAQPRDSNQSDGDNEEMNGSNNTVICDDLDEDQKKLSWEERQILKYFPPRLKRLTFRTNRTESDDFFYKLIEKCTRLQKLLSCSVHTSRLPLCLSSRTLKQVARCRKLRECGFAVREINDHMDDIWHILKSCKHLRKLRVVSFVQPPSELQFIQDFKNRLRHTRIQHISQLKVTRIERDTPEGYVLEEWLFS